MLFEVQIVVKKSMKVEGCSFNSLQLSWVLNDAYPWQEKWFFSLEDARSDNHSFRYKA